MLEVNKIFKSIKDKKIVANISFNIDFGEIFGLLGPNGAGKTSTFYIIAGLTRADKGNIILESKDISKMPMHARSNLGLKYLPQEPSIFLNLAKRKKRIGFYNETVCVWSKNENSQSGLKYFKSGDACFESAFLFNKYFKNEFFSNKSLSLYDILN